MGQKSKSEGCFGETAQAPHRIADATSAGWLGEWTGSCMPHCVQRAQEAWECFSDTTGPRAVSLEMGGQSWLEVDCL